jgi:DnaJ family protein C protein 7
LIRSLPLWPASAGVTSTLNQHYDLTLATSLRKRVKEVEQLKEEGNQAFKLVKLEEALKLYTDALEVCLVLNSPRARIWLHKEQHNEAIADFRTALEQAEFESAGGDVRVLRGELKRAEAALKRSKTKDYYKILGVPRDCNEADIKKAYWCEPLKQSSRQGAQ